MAKNLYEIIRRHTEFKFIINNGTKIVSQYFILYKLERSKFLENTKYDPSRILCGIMATKKIGNAIYRNLAKRRMRHILYGNKTLKYPDQNFCYIFVLRGTLLTSDLAKVELSYITSI